MRPSSECPVTRPELSRQRPRQGAPLLALQVQAVVDDAKAAGDRGSGPASLPQALAPGHSAGPSGPDFLTRAEGACIRLSLETCPALAWWSGSRDASRRVRRQHVSSWPPPLNEWGSGMRGWRTAVGENAGREKGLRPRSELFHVIVRRGRGVRRTPGTRGVGKSASPGHCGLGDTVHLNSLLFCTLLQKNRDSSLRP